MSMPPKYFVKTAGIVLRPTPHRGYCRSFPWRPGMPSGSCRPLWISIYRNPETRSQLEKQDIFPISGNMCARLPSPSFWDFRRALRPRKSRTTHTVPSLFCTLEQFAPHSEIDSSIAPFVPGLEISA